jgi:hypothetical protein
MSGFNQNWNVSTDKFTNPLNAELNPICWHYSELTIFSTLVGIGLSNPSTNLMKISYALLDLSHSEEQTAVEHALDAFL